jgi:hypothetical protein
MTKELKEIKIKHVDEGICMYKDCKKKQRKKSHYCCDRHNLKH